MICTCCTMYLEEEGGEANGEDIFCVGPTLPEEGIIDGRLEECTGRRAQIQIFKFQNCHMINDITGESCHLLI